MGCDRSALQEGGLAKLKPLLFIHQAFASVANDLNRAALRIKSPAFAMVARVKIIGVHILIAPWGTAIRAQYRQHLSGFSVGFFSHNHFLSSECLVRRMGIRIIRLM